MDINYLRIKECAGAQGVTIRHLAELVHMTDTGFKISIESGNFAAKNVISICEKLKISPNEFFGLSNESSIAISQSGNQNNQTNYLSSLSALEKQLDVKDKQIEHLMSLLKR